MRPVRSPVARGLGGMLEAFQTAGGLSRPSDAIKAYIAAQGPGGT